MYIKRLICLMLYMNNKNSKNIINYKKLYKSY